jgi:hypothetical protein
MPVISGGAAPKETNNGARKGDLYRLQEPAVHVKAPLSKLIAIPYLIVKAPKRKDPAR